MEVITQYLQANIVLVLFLVLGLGTVLGKLKIGSIDLGPTTGILLVGLVVGLLHLSVPPIVKGLSFTLYLFCLGILVGPGLVHLLSSRSVFKYLAHSLFGGVAVFASVYLVAKYFGFNGIVTAGLTSGAATTSAVLAAAQGVIAGGTIALPDGMSPEAASNLASGA